MSSSFRNPDWFQPDVREFLEQRNLAFCIHDHHGLEVPRWRTGPLAYWRFHGGKGRLGGYTEAPAGGVVTQIIDLIRMEDEPLMKQPRPGAAPERHWRGHA